MADGTVGVRQATTPDRLVDNQVLVNGDGLTVYRQQVVAHSPLRELRFDYDVRTDGNPVFMGDAPPGSTTGEAVWSVKKVTYDASGRATRVQVQQNITWDGRASGWEA